MSRSSTVARRTVTAAPTFELPAYRELLFVYSIARDKDDMLWFGTSGGLSRFDGKSFRNFTVADGMLESNVYALAVAPNGDVWAGTRRGVTRLVKQ